MESAGGESAVAQFIPLLLITLVFWWVYFRPKRTSRDIIDRIRSPLKSYDDDLEVIANLSVQQVSLAAVFVEEAISNKIRLLSIKDEIAPSAPELDLDKKQLFQTNATAQRIFFWRDVLSIVSLITLLVGLLFLSIPVSILFALCIGAAAKFFQLRTCQNAAAKFLSADKDQSKHTSPTNPVRVTFTGRRPFVGSGDQQSGWSFATDLTRSSEKVNDVDLCDDVEIAKIYEVISDRILNVFGENHAFSIETYEDGRYSRTSESDGSRTLKEPQKFMVYRTIGSHCGSISTFFVYLEKAGELLYSEFQFCIVYPVDPKILRLVSSNPNSSVLRHLLISLIIAPINMLFSPITFLVRLAGSWQTSGFKRRHRSLIKDDMPVNAGSSQSIREAISGRDFRSSLEANEVFKNLRLVEKIVLKTISAHLRQCGIDTSEFESQQTAILNQGVLVTGGEVRAGNIAAGRGSMAKSLGDSKQP